MVVQQAGEDGFAAAGATADLVGGLEDGDRNTFGGQGYGGGEPVGPAAHHHGGSSCQRSVTVLLVLADSRRCCRSATRST